MRDLHWEEVSLNERKAVYEIYRQYILETEGYEVSFEQCDRGWTGCRWITVKYTFGVA